DIEQASLLLNAAAGLPDGDLPLNLELDRIAQEAKRVEVLDLGARSEILAGAADGDIRVAAQRALFHVSIADLAEHQDLPQPCEIRIRLGRGANVRLRHDLDQRYAGAIQIDQRRVGRVNQLSGVLLEVNPAKAHPAHRATCRQGLIELRDLISLRQVGVEVVFACEDRSLVDRATRGQRGAHRQVHRMAIEHRQRAGVSEANGADVGVRRRAELCGAGAEDLRPRQQARMNLEADHRLPLRHRRRLSRIMPTMKSILVAFLVAGGASGQSLDAIIDSQMPALLETYKSLHQSPELS